MPPIANLEHRLNRPQRIYRLISSNISIVVEGKGVEMDASDGIIMGLYTDGSENANTDPLNDRDAMELFGFPLIENTSHQHPSSLLLQGGACYYADDKPLWWLTLRWMKMMLLKKLTRIFF